MHVIANTVRALEMVVVDARTWLAVGYVQEVDTEAGWVRRLVMMADGEAVIDSEGQPLTYVEHGQYVVIDLRSYI